MPSPIDPAVLEALRQAVKRWIKKQAEENEEISLSYDIDVRDQKIRDREVEGLERIQRIRDKIMAVREKRKEGAMPETPASKASGADMKRLDEQMQQFKNVEVIRGGTQITLPVGMDLETGAEWLMRRARAENTVVGIYEVIPGHCLDAAHAFVKSMTKKYGWVHSVPTPGFFGDTPPTMMGVVVSPKGDTVQVPWGRFQIPNVSGYLQTGTHRNDDGRMQFCIMGEVRAKYKAEVAEIARLTREYVKEHSIYKGMALQVEFPDPDEEDDTNPFSHAPKFIDVSQVNENELIFNDDVQQLLDISLWTLLSHMDRVRRAQIPVKRGILLHGRYGVGKTLVALRTAKLAVQNDITFVEAKVNQIAQAIKFAQMHAPAVVFVEDVDRADERGQRNDQFNEVLNTVDGLTSKSEEIIVVFTTNFIEKINKSMLRPGRLDSVIKIAEPDAGSVVRLVRLYARDMLSPNEDLTRVGELLAGEIAAVVREVVERSKLAAIHHGSVDRITARDLEGAALGMRQHLDLLKETEPDKRSDIEKAAGVLAAPLSVFVGEMKKAQTRLTPEGDDEEDAERRRALVGR